VARVTVSGPGRGGQPGDSGVYEFTMRQRLGGVHDGYWYTASLVADGNDWAFYSGGNGNGGTAGGRRGRAGGFQAI
jgi:hypothetical protein